MKNKYVCRVICLAGIVSLSWSCQRAGTEAPASDQPLSGTIRISAPLGLHRVNQAWAKEFSKIHPQVSFELIEANAPQRLADLEEGRADLGMVCQQFMKGAEYEKYCKIAVAHHGIVCIINEKNPYATQILSGLVNHDVLAMVFTEPAVQDWSFLPGVKDKPPMHVYVRQDSTCVTANWARFLWTTPALLAGSPVEGDRGMVEAIRNDVAGIGYCSSIFAYDPDTRKEVPGIKVVPIDHNFNGVLEHNEQFYDSLDLMLRAMWTGQYPCHLNVNLYYITELAPENRLIREYLKWVLDEGQNYLMPSGYIRLRSCDAGCQTLLLD